ncbi:MAG: OsmC family protein [Bacteroidetes bacterium]|nr:OsmC family protein [Bacteroidota bacterium]
MVPISIIYQGELRCGAVHDNSSASFITDAPKDNSGKGESFSPTDLVATALGSCMITTMAILSKKEGMEAGLDGTRVAVEKHMSTEGPRRIAKLAVRVSFPNGISAGNRDRLKQIGDTCPVAKSLHPDIVLDVQYVFPD